MGVCYRDQMESSRAARLAVILVPLLALASLACFAYPLYVIRPFRHQGPRELAAALFVLRIGPWVSILCAVAGVALVMYAWQRMRGWIPRTAAVLCILIAALGALAVRLDIYELLLFHPIRGPQFEAADRAKIDANRSGRAHV